MAVTVARPKLNWRERAYFPAILSGLAITINHFRRMLLGRTKVTMEYPEERRDSEMPDYYRGAPALVRDASGRVRCVACQLCEFICPPRAIKIVAGEIPRTDGFAKVVARRQAENDATLQAADADARARMAVSRASELVQRIRRFFEIT